MTTALFGKVVVANRGAAAARVIRALSGLGSASVAIYSEADAGAPYLALADEAHVVGPAPARESYLDQDRILAICRATGADAVHPGYGFLSENAGFAHSVEAAGLTFIGPAPRWIEAMGHKTGARPPMSEHGLPVSSGSGLLDATTDVPAVARGIGFPILVKPAAGGGGIGMIVAHDEAGLAKAMERARSMAARSFGNGQIYLERYLSRPRHIEFQVLGDRHGGVRRLFERDCSVQRRHQKVIEEAPAPALPRAELDAMAEAVTRVLSALGYDNRDGRDAAVRGWRLLVPGDEHPPSGRACRDRDGDRHRPRRGADPLGLGRKAGRHLARYDRDLRTRRRGAHLCRGPGELHALAGPARAVQAVPGRPECEGRDGLCRGGRRDAVLRSHAGQGDRARREPGRGARKTGRGALTLRDRGREDQHSLLPEAIRHAAFRAGTVHTGFAGEIAGEITA